MHIWYDYKSSDRWRSKQILGKLKQKDLLVPSLKILSWASAAILCLRWLLPTVSSDRWWSRKATRGDSADTSICSNDESIKQMDLRKSQVNSWIIRKTEDHWFWQRMPLTEREVVTWRLVTLRSSSEMYCSFLTRDLWADCLFANILKIKSTKKQSKSAAQNFG